MIVYIQNICNRISVSLNAIRFLAAGGVNTLLTYVLYLIFLNFSHYQIAYITSYILGIISSYIINAKFVFRVPLSWRSFFAYPIVYVVQYFICATLMYVFVEKIYLKSGVAPLVVSAITIPITYILSKWILIRKEKVVQGN